MRQKFMMLVIGMLSLIGGYMWTACVPGIVRPAIGRSLEAPVNPHFAYIAPEGSRHGQLSETELQNRGVTIHRNWQTVRKAVGDRPLDALLIDSVPLANLTDDDQAWLQAQFQDGVVMIGLGVDLDQMAKRLGLETLFIPGEPHTPLSADDFYMVYGMILGQPADIARMRQNNWLARSLRGDDLAIPGIQAPLTTSTGSSRGELNSTEGKDRLFRDLNAVVADLYQSRSQYGKTVQGSPKGGQ